MSGSFITLRRQGSRISVILIALLATACSSLSPHAGRLTLGAAHYPLLPSAVFTASRTVTQSVTLSGNIKQQFLLQTEVDPDGLRMVGLSGFGQKLFELQYIDNRLTIKQTPFLPDSLVPEKLFADFQLIYWPSDLLQHMFANTSIEFLETAVTSRQRLFRQGDNTVIEILYSSAAGIESNLVYRNFQQGYDMRIELLSTMAR
jgi:hypothetical protein